MRLAVPVLLVLAVSMPAYAAPYGPPQTFPDIKQRSPAPLFGPIGWAIKGLVEGGEVRSSVVLELGQGTERKRGTRFISDVGRVASAVYAPK